jgi:hypothetical protein
MKVFTDLKMKVQAYPQRRSRGRLITLVFPRAGLLGVDKCLIFEQWVKIPLDSWPEKILKTLVSKVEQSSNVRVEAQMLCSAPSVPFDHEPLIAAPIGRLCLQTVERGKQPHQQVSAFDWRAEYKSIPFRLERRSFCDEASMILVEFAIVVTGLLLCRR